MNPIEKIIHLVENSPSFGYPLAKMRKATKGQTALEYLLIVVVAMVVVVAVFLFMRQTTTDVTGNASAATGELLQNLTSAM